MKKTIVPLCIAGALCVWMGIARSPAQAPAKKGSATAPAAETVTVPTEEARAADEEAIRTSSAAFIEAYNAGDAKKLAALWSPDAVYLDPLTGESTVGRDAIEKVFADAFDDKEDVKLSVESADIEFISPNVAIVRGVAHVVGPEKKRSIRNSPRSA